jgi:hypothetical protein
MKATIKKINKKDSIFDKKTLLYKIFFVEATIRSISLFVLLFLE